MLAELGLGVELERPLAGLSGGEAARAALASILLSRYDVLLLDEPTNDLDFAGLERLEGFLAAFDGSVVIVSHDRAFLDRTVTRIVELDEWTHGAREYTGGWSEYEAERARRLARHREQWEGYVSERERIEEQAQRMQRWEERGYGQGRKKKKSKDVKKAFAKKLGRLEDVEKPYEPWELRLGLAAATRSGDVVVRLEHAVVERGTFRLGPLDLEVSWGERLAITGRNGSGKTTLLDALLGRLQLAAGTRCAGPGVVLGDLEQRRETFTGDGAAARRVRPRERAARRGGPHAPREVRPRRGRRPTGRRLALTGRADACRARAALRARRQLPRPRRADEPPRRRGDRGA